MLKELLVGLVTFIAFSLIPAIIIQIFKWRTEGIAKRVRNDIKSQIQPFLEKRFTGSDAIDRCIDNLRNTIIQSLRTKKINTKLFIQLNDFLNEKINLLRIKYVQELLENVNELKDCLKIIFSDKNISHAELMALFKEISSASSLSEKEKKSIISQLTENCIAKNKVIESRDLLHSLNIDTGKILRPLLKYSLIFLCVIAATFIFLRKDLDKFLNPVHPDITFGAVLYSDDEKVKNYYELLKNYIQNKTKLVVQFKTYDIITVDSILKDINEKRIDGLILNPGMYCILNNDKQREKLNSQMEIFARHLENFKPTYKSVFITLKKNFQGFCNQNRVSIDDFNNISSEQKRNLVKQYICNGIFAFNHSRSMSGFFFPRSFMAKEYDIYYANPPKKMIIKYSGEHKRSAEGILDGTIHVAAVFDALLDSYSDQRDRFFILASSPDIPCNSYWIRKGLNPGTKEHIVSIFEKLDKDTSELGKQVKGNKMGITGWKRCTSKEYYEMIKPVLSIIKAELPKPALKITINRNDYKLDNIYLSIKSYINTIIKPNLRDIMAWDIIEDSVSPSNYEISTIQIDCIELPNTIKNEQCQYQAKINDTVTFTFRDEFPEFDNKIIAHKLLDSLLFHIAPKPQIFYDSITAPFIGIGTKNGINYCRCLELPNNEKIDIEKCNKYPDDTRFEDKIVKELALKFVKQNVKIRYNSALMRK